MRGTPRSVAYSVSVALAVSAVLCVLPVSWLGAQQPTKQSTNVIPNIGGGDKTPPDVEITPFTGTDTVISLSVTIDFCDNVSLMTGTKHVLYNNVDVSTSFPYQVKSVPGCGAAGEAKGTVTLHPGKSDTLTAWIVDNALNLGTNTVVYTWTAPPPPPVYAVSVTPDSDRFVVAAGSHSGVTFFIRNTGTDTTTFSDSVKCTSTVGTMFPSGCSALPTSVRIPPNGLDTVIAFWTAGSAGAQGRVRLKAVQSSPTGTATDTGWVTVLANVLTAKAPVVDVASENPGKIVNRDLCLVIALPSDAASECGDLRIVHPLPQVRTMDKERAPALIYNSQFAHPFPTVEANVKLGDSTLVPDTVRATLNVSGQNYSHAWLGSDFQTGGTRRIAVAFDGIALATGNYPYTLTVTSVYLGGSSLQSQATGNLLVVNRSASAYGAGWWVDGVEQLFFPTSDTTTRLWIGGDGSTALYSKVTTNIWAAVPVDRPDTLKWDGTHYTRFLPHGVRVLFNSTGQHVSTINRLGHTTTFTYTGATLSSIGVPVPTGAAAVSYGFTYASGLLQTVTSPSTIAGHRTTTIRMTSGRITSVIDPDSTDATGDSVTFTYSTGVTDRIVTRTDRRSVVTTFAYDTLKKVSSASLAMGASKTIAWHLRNSDSLSFAGHAVRPESAYAQLDGPRLGVTVTRFSLDKFGEPTQIVNALGYTTTMSRGDARWPALVTRLRYPNGHTIGATYDTRGNLASSTDSSHVQGATFAKTTFQYDLRWDFLTQRTQPMGETWLAKYDTASGNRLYEQVGALPDTSRRIHYGYYTSTTPGLLAYVRTPLASGADSIVYDATLGNELKTRTPLGFWSRYVRDALGRLTESVQPINSTDSLVTIVDLDHYDRDTLGITYGTSGSTRGDSAIVRQHFDHENELLSASRRSGPDRANIGSVTTTYTYDNARRRITQTSPRDSAHTVTEQWLHDDSGNPLSWTTRRGYVITYAYDALNELSQRITPSTLPDLTLLPFETNDFTIHWFHFPMYPTDPGLKVTIAADTASFAYDSVGNLLGADNAEAHIRRAYYTYGGMRADELDIRTWKAIAAGGDFVSHVYRDSIAYDLDSRRTLLLLPQSVAPRRYGSSTALTNISYGYDSVTGLLSSVQDVLGNAFSYNYDAELRLSKQTMAGGVSDTSIYDGQGRLQRRLEIGNPSVLGSRDTLHADTLTRDMMDRITHVGSILDTVGTSYTLLGQIASTHAADPTGQSDTLLYGVYTWDALGNRLTYQYRTSPNQNITFNRAYRYRPGSGRLRGDSISVVGGPYDYIEGFNWQDSAGVDIDYDSAGNVHARGIQLQDLTTGARTEYDLTVNYYDAANRLRISGIDKCALVGAGCEPRSFFTAANSGIDEEYRYDALGRRILVRARRDSACTSNSCHSTIDRYLWDGDQILGEIRMPGGDSIEAKPGNLLERDTTTIIDTFAGYGRVFYTHGLDLDQPLDVIRNGYTHSSDTTFNSWAGAVAVVPHINWQGQLDVGTFDNGGVVGDIATAGAYCRTPPGLGTVCMVVDWPAGFDGVFNEYHAPYGPRSWFGSLTFNKEDGSGLQYSRHRYYDPSTGRFTQEDPLGLAGGLNLYEFAGGDPINYADPFGDSVEVSKQAGATVHRCETESQTCKRELETLKSSSDVWKIGTGKSGSCGGSILAGCTTHNQNGKGGTIKLMPGDFSKTGKLIHLPVNGVIVLGHEMGHALTDELLVCNQIPERCAIQHENVVRSDLGEKKLRPVPGPVP